MHILWYSSELGSESPEYHKIYMGLVTNYRDMAKKMEDLVSNENDQDRGKFAWDEDGLGSGEEVRGDEDDSIL